MEGNNLDSTRFPTIIGICYWFFLSFMKGLLIWGLDCNNCMFLKKVKTTVKSFGQEIKLHFSDCWSCQILTLNSPSFTLLPERKKVFTSSKPLSKDCQFFMLQIRVGLRIAIFNPRLWGEIRAFYITNSNLSNIIFFVCFTFVILFVRLLIFFFLN